MWQLLSSFNKIPRFLLPSPYEVIKAFILDFKLIMHHTMYTLTEAFIGLFIGILLAFIISILLDSFKNIYDISYSLIILTQTIPTVSIAPLLVLWFGYGILPKIILVVLTTFFPITISLLDGYKSVDKDFLNLLKVMEANKIQEYIHIKIPYSIPHLFAGLRISISYSLIGAVISEWLGGFYGLGVYMTRTRKSFSLDKMFAIIFFISILSLVLINVVKIFEKRIIKWDR